MKNWSVGLGLALLLGGGRADARRAPLTVTSAPPAAIPAQALLDGYCVTCHNDKLKTAGLLLDAADVEHVGADVAKWEKVIRKLRSGAMPPAGRARPDKVTLDALVASLETALDREAAVHPNPGHPTIHRLNRTEYVNAIRDLLAIEIDGAALLPADTSGFGFDNVGDVLSVSPGLLDRYLMAARKIGPLAIGDPGIATAVTSYTLPKMSLLQEQRMSERLPFGSRGGLVIRHNFPLDGEYTIKIVMQRAYLDPNPRGAVAPEQVDVRVDGERVTLITTPALARGAIGCMGTASIFCSGGTPTAPATGRIEETTERPIDAALQVRFHADAGPRDLAITFPQRDWAPEGPGPSRFPATSASFFHSRYSDPLNGRVDMAVEQVDIEGPFGGTRPKDTPSRRRIFVCQPAQKADETRCATTIVQTLARRAYRRPTTTIDMQKLLKVYRAGYAEGGFETGVEWVVERMLVSPDFLFRVETDPAAIAPDTAYRVSDVELASRLSFFLWSSIPDDVLLDLAVRGRLKDPTVLEQQVRRMLNDDRSKAFISNFFGQWLLTRNLNSAKPNLYEFPDFDDNLRQAFQKETELFVDSQVREDHSIVELLTANYTFMNERLAEHYGVPNIYGSHFRRVAVTDPARFGLLGQGSILTVTSYDNRTSPVKRGKWLLENVLGAPPPPPPANVPPFPENDGGQPKSVRERMEMHRTNPVCASCHARMDPLGFALENFDAVGRFRTTDSGAPVDASGVLPDGTPFNGPAEFRNALLGHRDEFEATVTEKLMTYALGRGVESYDMPAVRSVLRDAAAQDYRWSSVIMRIVTSVPFQMRRSAS